jgi:hypothetical protein
VTAVGIAIVLTGGAMIVLFLIASWRHRVGVPELETMSQQWRMEHRANDRHDSAR